MLGPAFAFGSAIPVLICDAGHRVTDVNVAAQGLLRRARGDVLGRTLEDLAPTGLRRRTAGAVALALAESGPASSDGWTPLELERGDGSRVAVELTCRARVGHDGHVVALRLAGEGPARTPTLSEREREVVTLVSSGMTGAEIAEQLYLAPATVERHVANALRKLGAKNRPHAIALAIRSGELHGLATFDMLASEGPGAPPLPLPLQTLDALEEPAAVLDADGNVLAVNEAWREFGRANGRFGVQAEQNYLRVCEEAAADCPDAAQVAWGLHELLENRSGSFSLEYRNDAPHDPRWVEMRATRYRSDDGPAVLVRHRSLTDRRLAEARAYLGASLLDDIETATVVLDLEGNVTGWRGGATALLGWDEGETGDRPLADLVLERRDRRLAQVVEDQLQRVGRWSGDLMLQRKDGSTFDAYARCRLLRGSGEVPFGIIVVLVDISERLRIQHALVQADNELRALADTMRDGWISGDAAGTITRINAAAQDLLGWATDELVGHALDEIVCAPLPTRRALGARDQPARQVHEECLLSKDGDHIVIEFTTSRFTRNDGSEGWAIVFRPTSKTDGSAVGSAVAAHAAAP
ncbi:MAG: PAS domain-containing protein [Patulibacter sp.]